MKDKEIGILMWSIMSDVALN